ncbi:uncharacterized protein K452DRAFT_314973 [Aplosporella prunicola CBS 121167]|uniref:Class II aldolase/adducin N-terminal domain-containing protein n=1 Tax=Aplosporella prunicola CBS 121167 TaxID=1176127 RepID=A0A6A6BU51_9PEZI|nr:uncharacterized protein K452DRAFT_314973 [Aplosporella prunicola CBS 121167]KAF2146744.1 hypothetical protein K452DRAFT_314973 [Aplosporella prunicola CBS 121167]
MTDKALIELFSIFITANHVLSHHGLVDGFGHISVRNPGNPENFFMTGSMPPALMKGVSDIAEFDISEVIPVSGSTSSAQSPYSERFVHSRIYAQYPAIQSVIHSHSPAVVAQGLSGVHLQPIWHMAGFLGDEVPIFDPRSVYNETDKHNLLVNNKVLGGAMAALFGTQPGPLGPSPKNTVVMQRGHGFTTWGLSIKHAVYRAVYTQESAKIQQSSANFHSSIGNEPVSLDWTEQVDCQEMNDESIARAWQFWEAQARADALYRNDLDADYL